MAAAFLAASSAPSSRTSFTIDDGRIVPVNDDEEEEEEEEVLVGPAAAELPEEDPCSRNAERGITSISSARLLPPAEELTTVS
jgi:hypothetical protein